MYTQMWCGKDQMEEGGRGDRPNNHGLSDWLEIQCKSHTSECEICSYFQLVKPYR